jgi:hypothetical protein
VSWAQLHLVVGSTLNSGLRVCRKRIGDFQVGLVVLKSLDSNDVGVSTDNLQSRQRPSVDKYAGASGSAGDQ